MLLTVSFDVGGVWLLLGWVGFGVVTVGFGVVTGGAVCGFGVVTTTGGLTVGAAVTGGVGAAVCVSLETVVLSLVDPVSDSEDDVVVSELVVVVVDVDVLVVVVVRDESSFELS